MNDLLDMDLLLLGVLCLLAGLLSGFAVGSAVQALWAWLLSLRGADEPEAETFTIEDEGRDDSWAR